MQKYFFELDIGTRAWEHGGVEAPQTGNSVRGPHEGFTETLRTNTSLVRREILLGGGNIHCIPQQQPK